MTRLATDEEQKISFEVNALTRKICKGAIQTRNDKLAGHRQCFPGPPLTIILGVRATNGLVALEVTLMGFTDVNYDR